jgi:lipopolysaccharide assembly protein A
MKIIERLLAIALFLVLVGFAIVNTTLVELHFIGIGPLWRAPMVVFLLLFFGAGVACGLLAVVPTWFRQRREISRLKKSNKQLEASAAQAVAGKAQTAVVDAPTLLQPPIPL